MTKNALKNTQNKAIPFLNLAAQQKRLAPRIYQRIEQVLTHCHFVMGPEVQELETRLAQWCGAEACVGVSSGTDALCLALMAEGIGQTNTNKTNTKKEAVFLPSFTYTATAEVPLLLGAMPVFVDIDPHTFQIDPVHLRARIHQIRREGVLQPRAIIGVDLFGQPAPWVELRAIAQEEDLFLLADCAQSFGATLDGHSLGREAVATTLSFFPSKPLGGYGDGGAILTDDPQRAALYRSLRTHGEGATRYEVLRIGMNARLDTLQAAVLLAKLELFHEELQRRESIACAYDHALAEIVRVPARVPNSRSAWAVYAILLNDRETRTALQTHLKTNTIATAIYYPMPLHQQPAYKPHHDGTALPVSENVASRILALPLHPDLTDEDVARVISTIKDFLCENRGAYA